MGHSSAKEYFDLHDGFFKNFELSGSLGFETETKVQALGVGPVLAVGAHAGFEMAVSSTASHESSYETSVSFVLGDEEKDDEFALDLYVDMDYGTCK